MDTIIVVCNNHTKNIPMTLEVPEGYRLVSTRPVLHTQEMIHKGRKFLRIESERGSTFFTHYSFRRTGPEAFCNTVANFNVPGIGYKRFEVKRI